MKDLGSSDVPEAERKVTHLHFGASTNPGNPGLPFESPVHAAIGDN
jgi:hypothetical protein